METTVFRLPKFKPPLPIAKKLVVDDYAGNPYLCIKFGSNLPTQNITKILFIYLYYLFFGNSPTGQSSRWIFELEVETTQTRARMCSALCHYFGCLITHCSIGQL